MITKLRPPSIVLLVYLYLLGLPADVRAQLRPGTFSTVTVTPSTTTPQPSTIISGDTIVSTDTTQGANLKKWAISQGSGSFVIATENDAGTILLNAITMDRSGNFNVAGQVVANTGQIIAVNAAVGAEYVFESNGSPSGLRNGEIQYSAAAAGTFTLVKYNDNFTVGTTLWSVDTSGNMATGGTITERSRAFTMGSTQVRAYNAGDFTSTGGGTWTVGAGSLNNFTYRVVGDTMWINLSIINFSISGTVSTLQVTIPGGFTAEENAGNPCELKDNSGTFVLALGSSTATTNTMTFFKVDGSAFAASSSNSSINCHIMFKVQ